MRFSGGKRRCFEHVFSRAERIWNRPTATNDRIYTGPTELAIVVPRSFFRVHTKTARAGTSVGYRHIVSPSPAFRTDRGHVGYLLLLRHAVVSVNGRWSPGKPRTNQRVNVVPWASRRVAYGFAVNTGQWSSLGRVVDRKKRARAGKRVFFGISFRSKRASPLRFTRCLLVFRVSRRPLQTGPTG